jgi:hypothetical protein
MDIKTSAQQTTWRKHSNQVFKTVYIVDASVHKEKESTNEKENTNEKADQA